MNKFPQRQVNMRHMNEILINAGSVMDRINKDASGTAGQQGSVGKHATVGRRMKRGGSMSVRSKIEGYAGSWR